ncbi:hypothetical protein METP3_02665 [Methanosarcinales archaeon]|nr:hypothetical protein METP3_02665 [Methanosarcinales archaeon]
MTTVTIGGGLAGLAAAYKLAGKDNIILIGKNLNSEAWRQVTGSLATQSKNITIISYKR